LDFSFLGTTIRILGLAAEDAVFFAEQHVNPPTGQPGNIHVSIRDAMLLDARNSSTADAFAALGELGASAIELEFSIEGSLPKLFDSAGTAYSLATDAQLREVRDALALANVRTSALLLGTDFAADDPRPSIEWTLRAIAAAKALGAPAVRIDMTHRREMPRERARERFLHCISRIFDQSRDSRVDLGIENHGAVSNDPEFLDAVFAAEPNPRLGLTLDIGNFYWYGYPLEELYGLVEHFAPRARHTHIKSINYPPERARQRREMGFEYGKYCSPLDEGNLDLPRIVRTLDAAGYRRGLCIENEALGKYPAEQRMGILRRDVAAVKDAIAKIRIG
jgi:sugar phosphate isomerase/epimerase